MVTAIVGVTTLDIRLQLLQFNFLNITGLFTPVDLLDFWAQASNKL